MDEPRPGDRGSQKGEELIENLVRSEKVHGRQSVERHTFVLFSLNVFPHADESDGVAVR
jgi:hypothetical protein